MRYFTKKLLTKVTISLIAGIASAIGMKLGDAICDEYSKKKVSKTTDESYA